MGEAGGRPARLSDEWGANDPSRRKKRATVDGKSRWCFLDLGWDVRPIRPSYQEGSYEQSVKYFKAATRRKDDDHLFYYGLALAYFELGDLEGVKKNIGKARYYAWDEEKKAYYDQVRDTLVNSTVSQ